MSSSDVAVVDGEPRWWRHATGAPGRGGTFDYWDRAAAHEAGRRLGAARGSRKHLMAIPAWSISRRSAARIIEVHLRFADQWPDLYGDGLGRGAGPALQQRWQFDDSTGARLQRRAVRPARPALSPSAGRWGRDRAPCQRVSLQITFHETGARPACHAARRLSPRHRQLFRPCRRLAPPVAPSARPCSASRPWPPDLAATGKHHEHHHPSPYLPVRQDWLDRRREEILEPDLPIVDPHHHLWDRPGWRYLLDELLADLNSGHNIVATVFVQCRAMHRADGPEELRPVGETEFVNGVAAMSASGGYGPTRVCAGIVGHADLHARRAACEQVLEAHHPRRRRPLPRHPPHRRLGRRRRRSLNPANAPPPGLLGRPDFPRRLRRSWRRSASPSTPGSTTRRSPS